MLFYAPGSQPSKISVQIVRFKDDRLMPEAQAVSQIGTPFATAFYQSLLKKFMISPIETSNVAYDKYLEILFSETFILNPKESTDPTDTRYRQLDIFKWMSVHCLVHVTSSGADV
jgi:hypothetical protein